MRYKIVISSFLLSLSLMSFNSIKASTINTKNPVKKGGTAVLKESKQADEEIKKQIDALLEEMSTSKADSFNEDLSDMVLNAAFDFEGVRYRFGGSTRSGLDCSGLVKNAFTDAPIDLPRSSAEMAKMGSKISQDDAQKGDLIFFRTGRGSRISHVGIVTEVANDEIKFIHSSTTRGVIVSTTKEDYYKRRFVQINRVLSGDTI